MDLVCHTVQLLYSSTRLFCVVFLSRVASYILVPACCCCVSLYSCTLSTTFIHVAYPLYTLYRCSLLLTLCHAVDLSSLSTKSTVAVQEYRMILFLSFVFPSFLVAHSPSCAKKTMAARLSTAAALPATCTKRARARAANMAMSPAGTAASVCLSRRHRDWSIGCPTVTKGMEEQTYLPTAATRVIGCSRPLWFVLGQVRPTTLMPPL